MWIPWILLFSFYKEKSEGGGKCELALPLWNPSWKTGWSLKAHEKRHNSLRGKKEQKKSMSLFVKNILEFCLEDSKWETMIYKQKRD